MPSPIQFLIPPRLIALLLWVVAFSSFAAEWHDPALPMADAEKPVYQWTGWPPPGNMWLGGKCSKVRIPSAEDYKLMIGYEYEKRIQDIEIAEIKRGSWLFLVGCVMAGIGVALHFFTAYPIAQRLAEWVLAGGVILAATGLFIKKASEYQNLIVLAFSVILVGIVLYRFRGWSISHIIKRKTEDKEKLR